MRNIGLLLNSLNRSLREVGVFGSWARIRRELSHRNVKDEFDLIRGTDTAGEVSLWQLDLNSENAKFARKYQTAPANILQDAVKFLRIDPGKFTFIDLGSGKGRALIVAIELGFKYALGVEFARSLAEIGQANLSKLNMMRGSSIHGDAADFVFPDSDIVIYLFNPFEEVVLAKVVANLSSFHAKHPDRTIYVIYNRAKHGHVFDGTDFLVCINRLGGSDGLLIWKTK